MESVKQTPIKKWEGKIVMENNENLVTNDFEEVEEAEEVVTENAEQTAEETPKTYTQEEVNAIVGKRIARNEAKIRKEYDRKYGELETVLKAGTGKDNVEEMTSTFKDFYQKKGINIPQKPEYSARDIEILARAEADDIIRSEEAEEEFERLEKLGAKMTAREQATFKLLAEHLQNTETSRELAKIGASKEVYESQDFKAFAAKINSNVPIAEVYDMYNKMQPKKQYQTMGSMKQSQDKGVKDYYSPEEIERLTEEDLDDPKVWEAVRRSMTGR